jgi:hypothetical protein
MDEGRKRVVAIVAGILVARHLKSTEDLFDNRGSPRTEAMLRLRFSGLSGSCGRLILFSGHTEDCAVSGHAAGVCNRYDLNVRNSFPVNHDKRELS